MPKKKQKKLKKYHYGIISSQNSLEKANKERKYKLSFRFVSFLPDALLKISKKLQKNSKNWRLPVWLHLKPE